MEKRVTVLQSEILVNIGNINCEGSDTLRTNCRSLSKIKHFPVIGWEVISSSQDCVPGLYSNWNRVVVAKVCAWILVAVGIIRNEDVPPGTRCWTKSWVPVNCMWCVYHQALERSKAFSVAKWKNKRIGSGTNFTNASKLPKSFLSDNPSKMPVKCQYKFLTRLIVAVHVIC